MINAIIFDMDGVLIDTEKYITKFWCQSAKEYGFNMTLSNALYIRSLSKEFAEIYLKSEFGESFNYDEIRNRRRELMDNHLSQNGVEIKNRVKHTLERLKEKNVKMAVATSTDLERTEKYLKEIKIYHLFDNILCTPMVSKGKPMPDIYLSACKKLEEKPSNCIAVEDSPNGIISAYNAGCKVIMVPDLTQPSNDIINMLFGVANRFEDLLNFI